MRAPMVDQTDNRIYDVTVAIHQMLQFQHTVPSTFTPSWHMVHQLIS